MFLQFWFCFWIALVKLLVDMFHSHFGNQWMMLCVIFVLFAMLTDVKECSCLLLQLPFLDFQEGLASFYDINQLNLIFFNLTVLILCLFYLWTVDLFFENSLNVWDIDLSYVYSFQIFHIFYSSFPSWFSSSFKFFFQILRYFIYLIFQVNYLSKNFYCIFKVRFCQRVSNEFILRKTDLSLHPL